MTERYSDSQEPKKRYRTKSAGRSDALAARWKTEWRDKRVESLLGHPLPQKSIEAFAKQRDVIHAEGHSPEAKRRMSEKKGGIGIQVLPLLLLGLTNGEICLVTGLTRTQVKAQRYISKIRKHEGFPEGIQKLQSFLRLDIPIVNYINEMDLPFEDRKALLLFYVYSNAGRLDKKLLPGIASLFGIPETDVEACIDYVIFHLEEAWENLEKRIERETVVRES